MTKIIYRYTKRKTNDVCYIDKKYIKYKNENINDKEMNNLDNEENVIKANILDFSLDHNKDALSNNISSNKKNRIIPSHYDKDCQESVGEINLSFSNDDINTFKCKENTIEAVFNELNNVNSLNNDSEIKVTFGQENIYNINNNYNNFELSTEGRIINGSFNHDFPVKNKKISKIPKIPKHKRCKIKEKEETISSVIIHDNKEQNEDIKINIESNKNIERDKIIDMENNSYKEGDLRLRIDKIDENNIFCNTDRVSVKDKKIISSEDVINFAEKLGSIFDKKFSYSNENKNECFNNINIYSSNFNIYENKENFMNNEFINEIPPKCRTYKPDKNKYLEILSHNDLTPFNKLELRINNETNIYKQNSIDNNNSINEIDSENENNVTFSKNNNQSLEEVEANDTLDNKSNIKNEINFLLNIITINNFYDIENKISSIIANNAENKDILSELILNKSITEIKYSYLYIMLYKKLYYNLKDDNNENNSTNQMNIYLKKKFEYYINDNECREIELKNNIFGIINLIGILIFEEIILIENGFNYLEILYTQYINNTNNYFKNILLEANILLLERLWHIIHNKKDYKNQEFLNHFIEDKIKILIENSSLNIPIYIINKIKNLSKENNIKLDSYEEYMLNKYKNINNIKINESKIKIVDYYTLYNINYEILFAMKNNLITYSLNNDSNEDIYTNLYSNYQIELYDIIRYYIEICIDYVDNELLIDNCNKFINNIIENYLLNNKRNENDNIIIVNLLLNIDDMLIDNKNMYQIMGYLLYSLINYEIYKIEDLNNFIGKENNTLINIAIIIKYIIIYCNKDYVGEDYKLKILDEFKQTDLFKSNIELFDIYVINDLLL